MSKESHALTRALELRKGAYDLHQHVEPDVWNRSTDAYDYAERAANCGMAGFVLKNHGTETASLACLLKRSFPSLDLFGSFVVNYSSSGGWSPPVVETALLMGARIIYMPTHSSEFGFKVRGGPIDGARVAAPEIAARPEGASKWVYPTGKTSEGGIPPGLTIFDDNQSIRADVFEILELIRSYDAVLGTGHLGPEEIMALIDAALDMKIERIVITHVLFPGYGILTMEQKQSLANRGALLEHAVQVTRPLPVFRGEERTIAEVVADIRAVGADRCVYSTNYGSPLLPSPEVGMLEGIADLIENGITEDEIAVMVRQNPSSLLH